MDPNKTLALIRTWTAELLDGRYDPQTAELLAEAINNLDTWLSRGGFLPQAWQASPVA